MKRLVLGAVGLVAVVFVCGVLFGQRVSDQNYCLFKSITRSRSIVEACIEYRRLPGSQGNFPASLAELQKPLFHGMPLIDEYHLRDGWGKPLRFAVIVNAEGEPEVYAWAEHDHDGKVLLHGAKAGTDGRVIDFGMPE